MSRFELLITFLFFVLEHFGMVLLFDHCCELEMLE